MPKYEVIYANKFQFTNENTGQLVQGVSVTYLPNDPIQAENSRGKQPLKLSTKFDQWSNIEQVPGVYEMDFGMKAGKGGKPEMTLEGLKYASPVKAH